MRRGIAELPLHYGSAPKWLFERQKKLLFEISRLIIEDFGTEHLLNRISDPIWFQILGCISGFDWHSSGVTTTVTAALKESFLQKPEYGVYIFGGKGKSARGTPIQIENCRFIDNPQLYITISKLTAKVDSNCIQDGYQLYHHTIFVDSKGNWAVVQQGMNPNNRLARRYHWFNKTTLKDENNLILEPHTGIASQRKENMVLNLVDRSCEKLQKDIVEYFIENTPDSMISEVEKIMKEINKNIEKRIILPQRHYIVSSDFDVKRLYKIFCKAKNNDINSFRDLVLTDGVGAKTLRALCLVSEVVYGNKASLTDPARFSYAFGGKDGHPYPVDRVNYDIVIGILKDVVDRAKLGDREKIYALKKLSEF